MNPTLTTPITHLLVQATPPDHCIDEVLAAYFDRVQANGFWNPGRPVAMVRCADAHVALADPALAGALDCQGLYLFCASQAVRYVGMTTQAGRSRLRGRYLGGPKSQYRLAVSHETALRARGLDGFPADITASCSLARRRGALDFARHGTGNMWFTFLPMPDASTEEIKHAERALIAAATRWNAAHAFEPPVNVEHNN